MDEEHGNSPPEESARDGLSGPSHELEASAFPPPDARPPFPLRDIFLFPFRALASLQLAVALIAAYAGVLAWATFYESRHGTPAAHAKIYDTAWFAALHILLGVNVLAALLARLPWRRRHFGFIVTHAGILVLLIGCAATRYWGVEAQLPIYEGQTTHMAYDQNEQPLELGFQVYLHQFRRKLDPGSSTPSHYSSRVDFFDRGNPPEKLQENVLISLNKPVDFTDPVSCRTYRLFQASFSGPWTPGEPKFDELVGRDHTRDQVYLSRLSVNYDPGRWWKYIGSAMIVVGIALVYYGRHKGEGGRRKAEGRGQKACVIIFAAIVAGFAGNARAEQSESLDWTAWRHLPTFAEGRVMPLDTFARETVEAICGRPNPTLVDPDAPPNNSPKKIEATELLFRWMVEPEHWERTAFLSADRRLRRDLDLPTHDATGRTILGVSPYEVEHSDAIRRGLTELQRRAEAEGSGFRPTDLEKRLDRLMDSFGRYRAISFNPKTSEETPRRFFVCWRRTVDALQRLTGSLAASRRISKDATTRGRMVAAAEAWRGLIAAMHGSDSMIEKIEPAVAAFHAAADRLAASLASPDDAALTALAADLRHEAVELHTALYDDGDTLRLVPALEPGALEETRTPDDEASPWLGVQAMLYGSDALLAAYPRPELMAVRQAFSNMKAVYLDRFAADRPARFAVAMNEFADAVRSLAGRIEPLGERLPLRHRDDDLIAAVAYPPLGSTNAEVFYNRLDPFFWSWVAGLAATVCLLTAVGRWRSPLFWLGAATLAIGCVCTAVGLGLRAYITGLVPLTGMFETVEFVSFYAGLLGLWFVLSPALFRHNRQENCKVAFFGIDGKNRHSERSEESRWPAGSYAISRRFFAALRMTVSWTLQFFRRNRCTRGQVYAMIHRRRLFAVAGAIVSFTAAVLAYHAPASVMHRNLGAVTPILRDNFWLAVHVVTIMASYASAAIALILGNIALGYYLFGRYRVEECNDKQVRHRPPEACHALAGFIYTAIRITVLLLAAGTILGGLWADNAWGRFWGWDPKENWALISLLAYIVILHMRYLGWSADFGMAVAAVFGFTAILFTWYAVNFVLPTGMHSYGSGAAAGQWAVGAAVAAEWLFVLAAAVRRHVETHHYHSPQLV